MMARELRTLVVPEGVEGERAFTRTAQACDDDEPVQWQIEIKVL